MMEECKKMCKNMSIEEKRECVSEMMPKCLNSVLSALEDKKSRQFAKDMKHKLNEILNSYMTSSN